jgi:hypothetical protein
VQIPVHFRTSNRQIAVPLLAHRLAQFSAESRALTKRRTLRIGDSVPSEEGLPVTALLTTNLGETPLIGRGKVRDLYAVDGALLLVATDRISAFDHVLGTGIPGKGKILTQISLFWFDLLSAILFPIT